MHGQLFLMNHHQNRATVGNEFKKFNLKNKMAKQTVLPTQNNLFSSAADTQVSPSWFKTRSVNRKTQQLDLNVRTSLQQCPLDLNLSRLEGLLKMTQQTYRARPQSTAKAVENKKAA